jgi:hypothetical protein
MICTPKVNDKATLSRSKTTFKTKTMYSLVLLTIALARIEASLYTISDERIRSLDITPVLGRGYSIMTNTYQSTCLMVDETTVPSYNYQCK